MEYERYAALRDEKGVTDYRVATDIGISCSFFTEWKMKRSSPKVDKLVLIAKYLGVTLDELVGVADESADN